MKYKIQNTFTKYKIQNIEYIFYFNVLYFSFILQEIKVIIVLK